MSGHGSDSQGRYTGLDGQLSELEHTVFYACRDADMEDTADQRHMRTDTDIIGHMDRLIFSGLCQAHKYQKGA